MNSRRLRWRRHLLESWEQSRLLGFLLAWAAWIFRGLAYWHRHRCLAQAQPLPIPVVVVGNLHLGGTGKTPLVCRLAGILREAGYRPGIVSRGWGGRQAAVHIVREDDDPAQVGDEALLLAAVAPTAIGRDRPAAARCLLDRGCDLLLSDDGLQHYRLPRDIEIVVVDGARGMGNGRCLPAGPLREPPHRLREADFVVCNGPRGPGVPAGEKMEMRAVELLRLDQAECCAPGERDFGARAHAVAGIGAPERFFALLRPWVATLIEHPFPDHYGYRAGDLQFADEVPVLMTEKDAVKCRALPECRAAPERFWVLRARAELEEDFVRRLLHRLRECAPMREVPVPA